MQVSGGEPARYLAHLRPLQVDFLKELPLAPVDLDVPGFQPRRFDQRRCPRALGSLSEFTVGEKLTHSNPHPLCRRFVGAAAFPRNIAQHIAGQHQCGGRGEEGSVNQLSSPFPVADAYREKPLQVPGLPNTQGGNVAPLFPLVAREPDQTLELPRRRAPSVPEPLIRLFRGWNWMLVEEPRRFPCKPGLSGLGQFVIAEPKRARLHGDPEFRPCQQLNRRTQLR